MSRGNKNIFRDRFAVSVLKRQFSMVFPVPLVGDITLSVIRGVRFIEVPVKRGFIVGLLCFVRVSLIIVGLY